VYIIAVITLASISCLLSLTTKTVVPSAYRLTTLDENLAAEAPAPPPEDGANGAGINLRPTINKAEPPPMIYYSAAGSGVAEVRVILSGFVLHGFLGLKTLIIKTIGLILSVASGLSLGKEGPYVHIATCVGNIACRLFTKYDRNDAKRREVLSAAAAAGVAVAFGAPLGGVLFGLEEVAYFFPAKTLFRTFFCCITAALTLKFLNPYGTHKIVMFQVRYLVDWEYFEIVSFILVGVFGGAAGALFIKASRYWAKTFRRIPAIKAYPLLEVVLVALVTGLIGYWNTLTKLPVAKLLYNLAAPCDDRDNNLEDLGLCPEEIGDIPPILLNLLTAFLIKGFLTIITFGIVSLISFGFDDMQLTVGRNSPPVSTCRPWWSAVSWAVWSDTLFSGWSWQRLTGVSGALAPRCQMPPASSLACTVSLPPVPPCAVSLACLSPLRLSCLSSPGVWTMSCRSRWPS
jgi:chloride channel 3/4/5